MAQSWIVHGYVEEVWLLTPAGKPVAEAIERRNDTWRQRMPSLPGLFAELSFHGFAREPASIHARVMAFSGSIRAFEDAEKEARRFEEILAQLLWNRAAVVVESEFVGTLHARWSTRPVDLDQLPEAAPLQVATRAATWL